ncbi:MAG: hypothetical protein AAF789_06860 [Bacteroidota bacterium]
MTQIEKSLIVDFKDQVSKKLQVEGKWKQRHFIHLIALIEQESGIKISLSTIKRIWGENLINLPHPSTLNALVSVIGYENWLAFKEDQLNRVPGNANQSGRKSWFLLALLVLALVISSYAIYVQISTSGVQINGDILFEVEKSIQSGVPNTIVFHYDVSNIIADSFFIQQSWNNATKQQIDQQGNHFSGLYYYPGFHQAKLMANDSVVKTLPVHVLSDGWVASIRRDSYDLIPTYLTIAPQAENGLSISRKDLMQKAGNDGDFQITYYNSKEFGSVSSSDFQLTTRVKNDSLKTSVCPMVEIMMVCEVNIFRVRLTSKGCEHSARVRMGEVSWTGSDHSLLNFGSDLYDWQTLELDVRDKLATGHLNDKKIFSINFSQDFGTIKALVYRFSGVGSIGYVQLADPIKGTIYQEDFCFL